MFKAYADFVCGDYETGINTMLSILPTNPKNSPRIDFLNRYLLELEKAIDSGVDVRGYFHWSFMDNFEWECGYKERFGLIFVDYRNQERIIKDSGYWYKDVIKSNGEIL